MDDLSDLQARVAAAQEKLRLNADDQRKYGLRLNDVVTIVEGSLARQQDEMKRLQDAAVSLQLERDATRVAEHQTKSLYEAALTRLNLLQAQNEQLRNMVMTLLNVIEGRESASALQPVLQRLESTVQDIATEALVDQGETDHGEIDQGEPNASVAAPVEAAAGTAMEEAVAEELIETGDLPDESDEATEELSADAGHEAEAAAEETELAEEAEPAVMAEAEAESKAESANDLMAETESGDELEMEELAGDDAVSEESIGEEPAGEEEATVAEAAIEAPATETSSPEAETSVVAMVAAEEPAEEAIEIDETDAEEDIAAEDSESEDMPEDLGVISMNGHRDFVTDADEILANESAGNAMKDEASAMPSMAAVPAVEDENLVTALLDAEKALIEAGASGVANVNSPVAEIIRRISLRTREFSEASGV